ncbi:hypothetical protein YC2023_024516 [Brassica napus]
MSHSSVCQFSGATRRKWREVQLRMLSQRRAALGLPVRDPQESDPTRQQPSNPTD